MFLSRPRSTHLSHHTSLKALSKNETEGSSNRILDMQSGLLDFTEHSQCSRPKSGPRAPVQRPALQAPPEAMFGSSATRNLSLQPKKMEIAAQENCWQSPMLSQMVKRTTSMSH